MQSRAAVTAKTPQLGDKGEGSWNYIYHIRVRRVNLDV